MRIWVDCTAAAHPLVLRPIIERLRDRGHEVEITAREYGQTVGILDRLGLEHEVVGRHGGGATAGKGARARPAQPRSSRVWARRRGFDLALAHGSVDLAVVGALLRIPLAQMQDYEYAGLQRQLAFRGREPGAGPRRDPGRGDAPARAPRARKLFRYPGLKEDYYLADFDRRPGGRPERARGRPEDGARGRPARRPRLPPITRDNPIYERGPRPARRRPRRASAVVIRAHRGARPRRSARRAEPSLIVPEHAIDAQSLIACADLVVSAGGTMNREAVALGTPVYTIFSGRMGAVDERLIAEGPLRPLADPAALELVKRARRSRARATRAIRSRWSRRSSSERR